MSVVQFKLSEITVSRLTDLRDEMIRIDSATNPVHFNQNQCHSCVIGNGIRAGVMNGFTNAEDDFEEAVDWLHLPAIADLGDLKDFDPDFDGTAGFTLNSYLFGMGCDIKYHGKKLGFPPGPEFDVPGWELTAMDAVKRINYVLKAGQSDV